MAYAIGYAAAGREEAKPELFGAMTRSIPRTNSFSRRLNMKGSWNVHPGAATALLVQLRQNTSLKVSLKRVNLKPGKDDLSGCSFLYLTGLDDFHFDEQSRAALRGFLKNSGTLLVNNGLGLRSFDAIVRRELAALLPGSKPGARSADASALQFRVQDRREPLHSGGRQGNARHHASRARRNRVDGDLRVIYSPYDIEAAWLGCDYPLARAYEPHSGIQLGVNIMMYAATH